MIDLEKLEALAEAAPRGKWEVWTSNSWRRVMATSAGRPTAEQVIVPCVQRHDNHPDLMFGDGVKEWLEGVTPDAVAELVAEVRALREDKARLDSGVIMRTEWSDWNNREIKVHSRGNDLRAMIDEARAAK
jgi:hypothetical protein